MSQIYRSTSAGPSPPDVATDFQSDDGTANPDANIIIISTDDTSDHNDNGIRSRAGGTDGTASNEVQIQLTNRFTNQITTNDSSQSSTNIFSLGATPGTFVFWGKVVAFNETSSLGASWDIDATVITNGTVATEITVEVSNASLQGAMIDCVVEAGVSGNFFTISVTGYDSQTIRWDVLFEYRRSI